jgi:hypothetical protein
MKKQVQNNKQNSGTENPVLEIIHEYKIIYQARSGVFTIPGRLSMDLSALKVTLILEKQTKRKQRMKIDLYDYNQIEKRCTELSEKEGFDFVTLETDLFKLADLLEAYREEFYAQEFETKKEQVKLSVPQHKDAVAVLSQKHLFKTISQMLDDIGIVGEVDNRLLLFIIGSSYKSQNQLHALVQSNSGSGKSHLINSIAKCFPSEDVISFSRVTSKSLYHYKSDDLIEKLVVIQDMDGLDSEALYALRELQSLKSLTTSTTFKDRFGNLKSRTQTVQAQFASFGATTRSIYLDNESRSVLLKVDESEKQTRLILAKKYNQNPVLKREAEMELANMIRVLKPVNVVNPFAEKIILPSSAKMLRRLNQQFLDFVSQITFLYQYQRETDDQNQVISTKQDVKLGIELFFDSIWLKVDELDSNQRRFYETLKSYVEQINSTEPTSVQFTQREFRQELKMSATMIKEHFRSLLELEYLAIVSGNQHRGYKYSIQYWDESSKQRSEIKQELLNQLVGA